MNNPTPEEAISILRQEIPQLVGAEVKPEWPLRFYLPNGALLLCRLAGRRIYLGLHGEESDPPLTSVAESSLQKAIVALREKATEQVTVLGFVGVQDPELYELWENFHSAEGAYTVWIERLAKKFLRFADAAFGGKE